MITFNTSILIHKPVKQVFDFISTPENDFQWQYEILESNRLSKEFGSSASFFRSIGHFMGQRSISTFEVTEFEPNKRYGFKSLSGPLNSQTTYTFETGHHNTKVNLSIQAYAIHSTQVNEGVLEKKVRKQLKENLALLKDVLEAKEIQPILAVEQMA